MTQYYSGDDSSREHARPHTEPGADMQDDIHEIRVESYDTYPGARGSDRPRQEEEQDKPDDCENWIACHRL